MYLYYITFIYCFIQLYPAMECSFYVESYQLCRQRMSVKLRFPEKYNILFMVCKNKKEKQFHDAVMFGKHCSNRWQ